MVDSVDDQARYVRHGLFAVLLGLLCVTCGEPEEASDDEGMVDPGPVIGSLNVDGEVVEIRSALLTYEVDEGDPTVRSFHFVATPYGGVTCDDRNWPGWFLDLPPEGEPLPILAGNFVSDNSFFPITYSAIARCTGSAGCGVNFLELDYDSNNAEECSLEPSVVALANEPLGDIDQVRLTCPTTSISESSALTLSMIDIPFTVCHAPLEGGD